MKVTYGPLGRGVFATRRFATGEVVEDCPTVELVDADVTDDLNDYVLLVRHGGRSSCSYSATAFSTTTTRTRT